MTKDRLLELKAEDGKSKNKTSKNISHSQKTMDKIFKETQQMRAWMEAIEEETKLVKRLQTVILHTTRPQTETKDKMMNAMIKIKTLSLRVRGSLKTLERQKDEKLSAVECRMITIQYESLAKRFQMAMTDYQGALAHHKDQTETLIKTQLKIVVQTVMQRPAVLAGTAVHTQEEMEALLDSENTQVFVDNYVHETQALKLALQDAQTRHKEMLELEKSIKELQELFTDVSVMVHTQGEMINVIEYNVEHGTVKVNQGNQEMAQAYTKKKSARKKKMWCFILLLCVVGIFLVYAALHTLVDNFFTF